MLDAIRPRIADGELFRGFDGVSTRARHASRGDLPATHWILREKRAWADLADVVPQLVTIDLIIAELIIGRRLEDGVGNRSDN